MATMTDVHHFTFGLKYKHDDEKHPTIPEVDGRRHLTVMGCDSEMARTIVAAMTMHDGVPQFAFQYTDASLSDRQRAEGAFMVIRIERA